MGEDCCGSTAQPGHFHCHGCGSCCTNLSGRWARGQHRFQALPQAGVYRTPTPGGLRMFAWEADPFPAERLAPLLVLADARREQLIALAYEMEAEVCPRYDREERRCTIYEDRPLVCRAFPLIVTADGGLSVAVSKLCPAKVPVVGAAQASADPERVLAGLYPGEAAAALAASPTTRHLTRIIGFLEQADVVEPALDLDEDELDAWSTRPVLDLVELAEETGVLTGQAMARQADRILAKVRERIMDPA